jgi:hypothetical protein
MKSDSFSVPAFCRAIETRDSATMRGFYAENARIAIIDRDNPPSRPREIVGRNAISTYLDDVCGRTMTHKVENCVVDHDHLAFTQACAYPEGTRVFCSAMADLVDGKIASQTVVQAWDA